MMLPEFDQEMANARRAIEAIPTDNIDFKPHERSWSLIELATHVARLISWGPATLAVDEMDISGYQPEPALPSVDAVLELFDKNVAEARSAIEATDDARFMSNWSLKSGDTVHFSMPKAAVIRSFVLNHMIHHRGQLTVYLRMAGGNKSQAAQLLGIDRRTLQRRGF